MSDENLASIPNDRLTVEQLLARQEQFMRLFAQHEPMVHGFVASLVPVWSDAAEIRQETSLVLWRKFHEFESGTNFLRWACRIAEFEVRRFRSKQHRARLQFSDELLDRIAAARLDASEGLVDRQKALSICLAKLSDRERKLLAARYTENRPGNEIAERFGRPINTIYKSLQRIRASLFECISRQVAREELS